MSGTAVVSNTFANQSGPIPLSQLDANFTSLIDYANDPTNRSNYGVDTGVASTYTVALSPAAVGYTAGLTLTFKPGNTNTSSASINVNALGAKAIVNGSGANVSSGEIVAGRPLQITYDGTAFVTPTGFATAQAGAVKAWAFFNGTNTGTITALYAFNVNQIVRIGTGSFVVSLNSALTSSVYPVGVGFHYQAGIARTSIANTATFTLSVFDSAGTPVEMEGLSFWVYGLA